MAEKTTLWDNIKIQYTTTGLSAAALARRFHTDRREIEQRILQENWDALRQQYRCEKTARAVMALDASTRESRLSRVDALADTLLTSLEQAAGELALVTVSFREKIKTDTGEQVREYQQILPNEPGTVDRGGLKQLTAVLKDIKDVLVLRPEADVREQEARIAKLQRDLKKEEASHVTVQLEGGLADYAD